MNRRMRGWPVARRPHGRRGGYRFLSSLVLLLAGAAAHAAADAPVTLDVDLGLAAQHIVRVHETLAVTPGPLTLYYPQWIPGENLPSGPLDSVAGLTVHAGTTRLAWRRDAHDMYALHLQVPAGTTRVQVDFQLLPPDALGDLAGHSLAATADWAVLEFNQLVLYPAGSDVDTLGVAAAVTMPAGWQWATALPNGRQQGDRVSFAPVDLSTLVDSPLQAGAHLRRYDLVPGAPVPVHLDIAADTAGQLDLSAERLALLGAAVREAYALLGPPRYAHYDFLLTRSRQSGGFGLEHAASSDDRFGPGFLAANDNRLATLRALPHELVHAWNGKYRRPAGMLAKDFNTPMDDALQWVYEGLTDYWACLLSTRAGLWNVQQYRDWLAVTTAAMAHRDGRRWRSLQDTADAAPRDPDDGGAWGDWKRADDFYTEGQLLWLDVDMTLRRLSHGQRSLDDFARIFFAADGSGARVRGYGFDDVVAALQQVQPNDWRAFLRQRLDAVGDTLPEDGLGQGGWALAYDVEPSDYDRTLAAAGQDLGVIYALGMDADASGTLRGVAWEGPAFRAGLAPGMRLVSVDGKAWSRGLLHDVVVANGSSGAHAMTLQAEEAGVIRAFSLHYQGGLRYPRLRRLPGVPDGLGASVAGRATKMSARP